MLKKIKQFFSLHKFEYIRSNDYRVGNSQDLKTMHQFKCSQCEKYYHKHANWDNITTHISLLDKFGCGGKDYNKIQKFTTQIKRTICNRK